MTSLLHIVSLGASLDWSPPRDLGLVSWGVAAGRTFATSAAPRALAVLGVKGGAVATYDGIGFSRVNGSLSEHMAPCADEEGCYHDFGTQTPTTPTWHADGATSWSSPNHSTWRLLPNDSLVERREFATMSFSGLPYPSFENHFCKYGLRFGGTAGVVLPAADGGRTFLQTAIVNWPDQSANDSVATSIVVFSSRDGLAWTYLSTVAAAKDNPTGDEGPNEHALELLADGSLLVVLRLDCGDGTHHPKGQWGRFAPYVQTRSRDGGRTWSPVAAAAGAPGCAYPKLLALASGPLLLSGGRSIYAGTDDNDLWVSWAGDGAAWERHAISAAHNAGAAAGSRTFNASRVNSSALAHRQTVAYTSLLPLSDPSLPGAAALVGYDLLDGDDQNPVHHGYAMRVDLLQ